MDVWLPYGDVEVFLNLSNEEFGGTLDYTIEPSGSEWIDKFKNNVDKNDTIAVDPLLVYLADDILIKDLFGILNQLNPQGNLKVIVTENLHPFKLDANFGNKFENLTLIPWSDSISPSIILSALLPHPFFGFHGAPHIAVLGKKSIKQMLNELEVTQLTPGTIENNIITTRLLEKTPSSIYSVHIVPHQKGCAILGMGDIIDSFNVSIQRYKKIFNLQNQYPRLVSSVGGCPYDSLLWGTIQTLATNSRIVADDGELILISECSASIIESKIIREITGLLLSESNNIFLDTVKQCISDIRERLSIRLVSSLPNYYVRRLGFKPSETLRSAFQVAHRRMKDSQSHFLSWGYHATTS